MRILPSLLLSGALALGSLASYAQPSQQPSYASLRTPAPIKVDGRLSEKEWDKAQPLSSLQDIRGGDYPAPTKNTTLKMLWDDEYLYVGAYLEEDDIIATIQGRDEIIWKENDFEIFLDPDGDGKGYFEFEFSAKGEILDLIMSEPYSVGGNFYSHWDCPGLLIATSIDGTVNRSSDKDKGWGLEVAIPRKALMWGFDEPGAYPTWRMNFSRVEYLKGKGNPEENWVWSPTGKVDIHIPSLWGWVHFVDVNVGEVTVK